MRRDSSIASSGCLDHCLACFFFGGEVSLPDFDLPLGLVFICFYGLLWCFGVLEASNLERSQAKRRKGNMDNLGRTQALEVPKGLPLQESVVVLEA